MADAGEVKSWAEMRRWQIELLERSGAGLEEWSRRIAERAPSSEAELRSWLDGQDVRGYAQMLLVHETFGYPDFLLKTSDELIDGQYADREELRPILDAVLKLASGIGDVTVQARKTYVSLVGPRRMFAIVQATTKRRVDLGLRLEPEGDRLLPARSLGSDAMTARVPLAAVDEVDVEVADLLARAYAANL